MYSEMENLREVSCTVKPPVYLSVGPHSSDTDSTVSSTCGSRSETMLSGNTRISGCQLIDVQLHRPTDVRLIRFRNNYTYTLTVLYQSATVSGAGQGTHAEPTSQNGREWKVGVANRVLMPSCHCESPGAQKWVELGKETFSDRLEDVTRLKFILRQPSPHWREFGIENISCYYHDDTQRVLESPHVSYEHHQGEWSSQNKVERLLEVGRAAHTLLKSEKHGTESAHNLTHYRSSVPYEINLLS